MNSSVPRYVLPIFAAILVVSMATNAAAQNDPLITIPNFTWKPFEKSPLYLPPNMVEVSGVGCPCGGRAQIEFFSTTSGPAHPS